MVVKVLGPLETGSEALSPRERTILSALVVRLGVAVDPDELATAVWGDEPPATWEQQVRNAVARIRKSLGKSSVETIGADYRLSLDPDSIDSVRFERLVSTARGHALRQEHDRAADSYRRALALWRGKPLQDVRDWEPAVVEVLRLESIRQSAEEELLESRLSTGESASVIPDAERLVRDDPLRENRWAILALANYRANRQSDALATLRAARQRLDEELGIEPSARITELERAILRREPALDAVVTVASPSSECPYPGLRPFSPEEADLFFGRTDEVEVVLERLAAGGILTIAGPSGTGKSSLLMAGVIPRLRARGRHVEIIRPAAEGAPAIIRAGERSEVVAIDQAEELTHLPGHDVDACARAIRAVLDGGATIVLTVRSDALDAIRALPAIGDAVGTGVYLLGPLGERELREAIVEPAEHAGLRLEPGLVELVVGDSGDRASTLPHLSHALRETWIRREGTTLTVDGYRASGGIAGAIAQSAEQAFRALPSDEQVLCKSLMLRLVERSADGSSRRRRVSAGALLAEPIRRRMLERLAQSRIVALDGDAVVISHEMVAQAWPRLDAWLEEDAEGLRTLRGVESAAAAWEAGGRDDGDLLRGARLHTALDWRDRSTPDLTEVETAFLDAAAGRERVEQRELSERAREQRRQNARLRWALAGAAALLVTALVAGGVAVVRGQEAASASLDARIEAVTSTSLALRSSDPDVAALLAAEAYRRWPDDARVRSALWGLMTGAGGLVAKSAVPEADASASWVVPETGQVIVARDRRLSGGSAAQWETDIVSIDPRTGDVSVITDDPGLPPRTQVLARDLSTSADGRLAVVQSGMLRDVSDPDSCCVNQLDFYDLVSGERLRGSQLLDARTGPWIDISEDVAYVINPVTADVTAIDVRTGDLRTSAQVDPADTQDAEGVYTALAVVGDVVATGTADEIVLYDRDSLEVVRRISIPHETAQNEIRADSEGGLIGAGFGGGVRVDVGTGIVRWHQPAIRPYGSATIAVCAPCGTWFAADWDGNVDEFSIETGEPTGRSLETGGGTVAFPHVLPDEGGLLVIDGGTGEQLQWAFEGGPASDMLAAGRMAVAGPVGATDPAVVTARLHGVDTEPAEVELWDLHTDAPRAMRAAWFQWLGAGRLAQWHEADGGVEFITADGESAFDESATAEWGFEPGIADDFFIARPGPHAFVNAQSRLLPIDPASGRPVGTPFQLPTGRWDAITSVSESTEGDRVAVTFWDNIQSDSFTVLYDVASGEEIGRGLPGDTVSIIAGDEIISAGQDGIIRSDLDTLESHGTLPKPSSEGRRIDISDDGRTLLVATWDQRVWLYDLPTGLRLGDPLIGDSLDTDPAFLNPDGLSLLLNVADGVERWDLDPAAHSRAACRLAGRELSAQEWATYLGDFGPQRPTCS